MKKMLVAAAAACLGLCQPAIAQDFDPQKFRAHLMFLADDLLEGRDTGSRGHDIAAGYVASQFMELGLTPAANGGWYQQVPLVEYGVTSGSIAIGGTRFAHGKGVAIAPDPQSGKMDMEAPVVFVGYGLTEPKYGLDDYAGLDVRGKIVAVIGDLPEGLPSDVAAHLGRERRSMAARAGAVGMIAIRTRAEAERWPWERFAANAGRLGMTWVGPDGQPHVGAPGLRFMATLNEAAAAALFAGAPTSLEAVLDEVAAKRRPRGFPLQAKIQVTREGTSKNVTSRNVVAFIPGSDPDLADEYVAFTAHVDGVGMEKDGRVRAGAVDNASGVAAMLEAARALAVSPDRPRRGVLFVALTGEEKGLLGAQYLARNPVRGGRMVGLVNLDTPIFLYDFVDVIAFGAEHTTLGPVVQAAAEKMGVALIPDPLPEEGIFTRSDHYEFVREGVPSVFLLTGFGNGGGEKFKSYLAKTYHTPEDDLNLPFDWDAAARFSKLNYLVLREMADAPKAPLWYQGSYFGDSFAAGQAKAKAKAVE
ncbi:M28 family metallopeptidase [Sphingosinicella rhizophila]|uniref:M28 family metallopeptidase n=1 Tax=Sphingosinicella rhizophila TaxID=3050082 RepID=A0ABU3Q1Q5_9SPHN|nr:M28 family metallopeptidase [Sphingosinicella sp. GR2756]MDT9597351.1 M28 family metallopeptidase [Sphingosinicella sp. GR2756]